MTTTTRIIASLFILLCIAMLCMNSGCGTRVGHFRRISIWEASDVEHRPELPNLRMIGKDGASVESVNITQEQHRSAEEQKPSEKKKTSLASEFWQ